MGGAASKVSSIGQTVGRVGSGVFTLGGSEIARNNLGPKSFVSQALQTPGTILTGGSSNFGYPDQGISGSGTGSDPFTIDPAQIAADQASINSLGDSQRSAIDQYSASDQASRAAARQALAEALTKQSQSYFQQGLPATEETLNAQHLLNGSGLGQEIARQQGNLATNIANQVGVQGANDINRASELSLMGLQGQQGLQQQALSRGFSLSDFVRQANVAKAIGASAAPQVGNGKGSVGTTLSGVGSLAPLATAFRGAGKGAAGAGAGAAGMGAVGPMATAGSTLLPASLSLL